MSAKRNWEKIESEQAEKEKRQSEERERTIAELFHAIEELVSRRVKREDLEGLIDEARTLANEWKDPRSAKQNRRPLFDATSTDTNFLLAALVVSLRPSHQCLDTIRNYCPNELEKLISTSRVLETRAIISGISALSGTFPEPPPKRKYERKRRRWRRSFYNSIEYQFGGAAKAKWREFSLLPLGNSSYEPTCLADIFAGEMVNMQRLEDLFFGIERHQLAKLVSREDRKRRKYGHSAVVKIMGALLTEPRKRRKRSTPGRPRKTPWLNDADLRTRVLSGIEGRIMSIATELREADLDQAGQDYVRQWREEIANPFLAMVRRHLPDSGKK